MRIKVKIFYVVEKSVTSNTAHWRLQNFVWLVSVLTCLSAMRVI